MHNFVNACLRWRLECDLCMLSEAREKSSIGSKQDIREANFKHFRRFGWCRQDSMVWEAQIVQVFADQVPSVNTAVVMSVSKKHDSKQCSSHLGSPARGTGVCQTWDPRVEARPDRLYAHDHTRSAFFHAWKLPNLQRRIPHCRSFLTHSTAPEVVKV